MSAFLFTLSKTDFLIPSVSLCSTPPLTIRGGMVVGGFVPPVKKGKQEGGINEVLSVRRAKDKKPA